MSDFVVGRVAAPDDLNAYINSDLMCDLGYSDGSIITVKAKNGNQTIVAVYGADCSEKFILLSRCHRVNLGCYLGETISISQPQNIPDATNVEIAAIEDTMVGLDLPLLDLILESPYSYFNLPVYPKLIIPIYAFQRIIELQVISCSPSTVSVINDPEIFTCSKKKNPRQKQPTFNGINFYNIGGIYNQLGQICSYIENIFAEEMKNKSKAILITAPSGCGKTLIGEAISNETGAAFLCVNGRDISVLSDLASNQVIEKIDALTENNTPSIIFIDDIDIAIEPEYNEDGKISTSKRDMIKKSLEEAKEESGVTIIATAKAPLPKDLQSSFDDIIEIDEPNYDERIDIAEAIVWGCEVIGDSTIEKIAYTAGKTGADVMRYIQRELFLKTMKVLEEIDPRTDKITFEQLQKIAVGNGPPESRRGLLRRTTARPLSSSEHSLSFNTEDLTMSNREILRAITGTPQPPEHMMSDPDDMAEMFDNTPSMLPKYANGSFFKDMPQQQISSPPKQAKEQESELNPFERRLRAASTPFASPAKPEDPFLGPAERVDPFAPPPKVDPFAKAIQKVDLFAKDIQKVDPFSKTSNVDPFADGKQKDDRFEKKNRKIDPFAKIQSKKEMFVKPKIVEDPFTHKKVKIEPLSVKVTNVNPFERKYRTKDPFDDAASIIVCNDTERPSAFNSNPVGSSRRISFDIDIDCFSDDSDSIDKPPLQRIQPPSDLESSDPFASRIRKVSEQSSTDLFKPVDSNAPTSSEVRSDGVDLFAAAPSGSNPFASNSSIFDSVAKVPPPNSQWENSPLQKGGNLSSNSSTDPFAQAARNRSTDPFAEAARRGTIDPFAEEARKSSVAESINTGQTTQENNIGLSEDPFADTASEEDLFKVSAMDPFAPPRNSGSLSRRPTDPFEGAEAIKLPSPFGSRSDNPFESAIRSGRKADLPIKPSNSDDPFTKAAKISPKNSSSNLRRGSVDPFEMPDSVREKFSSKGSFSSCESGAYIFSQDPFAEASKPSPSPISEI